MKLATILKAHGHNVTRLSRIQRNALHAIAGCRSGQYGTLLTACTDCPHTEPRPHSCGHRLCPSCLNHCTSVWLDRQTAKLLPCTYFMVTFTLPAALRTMARRAPRRVYEALMDCAASTLKTFAHNDPQMGETIGMTAILHTHTRSKTYHPHVHVVIPNGGLSAQQRHWKHKGKKYLFNARALAKVFRARVLAQLADHHVPTPDNPRQWIAHVKRVGAGLPALKYLSRYLYRGVIPEKDILSVHHGQVTFCYRDSRQKRQVLTLSAERFIKRILQHALPKGFRRVRDYGFLHGNARATLKRVQWALQVMVPPIPARPRPTWCCPQCGGVMQVLSTKIKIKRVDDG